MLAPGQAEGPAVRIFNRVLALWLAGVALRVTILAVPPVIPLIRTEFGMTETQVGILTGLPPVLFAVSAVLASLLIARTGALATVVAGIVATAAGSVLRGLSPDVLFLYAATVVTGFGVAIMQPGMPTLVREWLPSRMALGTIAYTAGMLMGASLAPILTIPVVLPLVGGSWRLSLMLWAVPALLIAPVFLLLSPKADEPHAVMKTTGGRWWPHWRDPLIWLLGISLGSNNSAYFATNAFLGDFLTSEGKSELLGPALAWLNGFQIVALVILIVMSQRFQRRAWPFLIFGPALLASFIGLVTVPTTLGIITCAALIGLTTAVTLTSTLALPPLLAAPADVPRTAAGMFTVSYTVAIIVPTISGALWDYSGRPWTAFVPLCICAVILTVLGVVAARYRPAMEDLPYR